MMVLAMGFLAACNSDNKREFYKVSEIWADAGALDGQTIAVRGWAGLRIKETLKDCPTPSCSCNDTSGSFSLVEEIGDGGVTREVSIPALTCSGDDCSMTCSPFDPTAAVAFEITGVLRALSDNGRIASLKLEDIDLEKSHLLSGADCLCHMVEYPLETGKFKVDLAN